MPLLRLWRLLQGAPAGLPPGDEGGGSAVDAPDTELPPPDSTPAAVPEASGRRGAYLRWLLALRKPPAQAAAGDVVRVFAAIDAVLASNDSCDRLLRRAPNVIPRLINTLRTDGYSRDDVVGQIGRDMVLTTEVLRLARSTLYAHLVRGTPSVGQAVDLLGRIGLKQVVARVLLRPLLNADGGSLQARAAPRIWDDSERCATLCAALAPGFDVDPVDAYLAGLLQSLGWSALLKAVELHGAARHLHQGLTESQELVDGLFLRRDRLLARLIPSWDISPGLTGLGQALAAPDDAPRPPLLMVLTGAHDLVLLQRLHANGELPAGPG